MAEPLEDPRVFNPTSDGATDSSTPPEPIENQEYKGQDKARTEFLRMEKFGNVSLKYPLKVDVTSPHYVVFYP